jgi:pre-rRNA-processing protein TSR3
MTPDFRLIIYHANEDDPKKCSARKMYKFNLAYLTNNIKKIPNNTILLNPFTKKSLSKEDTLIAKKNGIVAIDCSWKNAENSFYNLDKKNYSRALPYLIAVNPINYGKILKLTTLEAFAAALYILDNIDQAKKLLEIYKWGPHFLELNREPLEDYRKAKNSNEVIDYMRHYLK